MDTLRFPAELSRQLDDVAARSGRSRATVIEDAVRVYVAQDIRMRNGRELPRSIGIVSDDEVTGENSEDWLRANWRPEDDRGPKLITLDTSGAFTLFNDRDPLHQVVVNTLVEETKPPLLPAATRGELAYLLERRFSAVATIPLLDDLRQGRLALDCGFEDFTRVRDLVRRYADLPLGLVDAAVIACAERNGGGC